MRNLWDLIQRTIDEQLGQEMELQKAIVASCWTYFTTIKHDARNQPTTQPRGLSPRANHTDRAAAAAGRRS
jgi:hypothetical protein